MLDLATVYKSLTAELDAARLIMAGAEKTRDAAQSLLNDATERYQALRRTSESLKTHPDVEAKLEADAAQALALEK